MGQQQTLLIPAEHLNQHPDHPDFADPITTKISSVLNEEKQPLIQYVFRVPTHEMCKAWAKKL